MEFWTGLFSIIIINIVLSGDNAVVIAMACKNLPESVRSKGIVWGSVLAIVLRVILTFIAAWLLQIPLLQSIGGLLLLWIAVNLLAKDEDDVHATDAGCSMRNAIKTIVVADLVMSLDNVLAIAGAAKGNFLLLILGLAISMPLIIFGSNLLVFLMKRWPIIVYIGTGILGWTAGEMIISDKLLNASVFEHMGQLEILIPIFLTIGVIAGGQYMKRKAKKLRSYS